MNFLLFLPGEGPVEEADEDREDPYEAMCELMAAWDEVTPQLLRIDRRKIRLIEKQCQMS